jgi:ABC-type multidrug transport system ATPase subunit
MQVVEVREIVAIKNLGKSYSGRVIFHNVNMTVNQHEPIVIMGENGCGKSTLLKIIAGVLESTEGAIKYDRKIKISFVPDRFPKLPFSVESYLMHMGKIQRKSAGYVNKFMDEYFTHLNMPQTFRKTKISKCSKGTIQKINILQALITKPDLIVLDEPFAGLDEDSADNFVELLQKLSSDGVAIVMACHERKLAQKVSDKIYVFKDNQCYLGNGYIERYYVKFADNGKNPNFGDIFVRCELKADGYYETFIEKDNLAEILGALLSQGFAVHSVNPKYSTLSEDGRK